MAGLSNKESVPEASKFEGEGMIFRAKLIGSEIVPEARGDKICQESIQKLKAIVKASKEHKQKINVNVSLEGLKILDQATGNVEHTHEVHRISFISRDVTDSRAFGYVYGPGDGSHKFFAIKTEKAVEALVLSLRDLCNSYIHGFRGVWADTPTLFRVRLRGEAEEILTRKRAEALVLSLRDLFQVVYDLKKKEVEEAKKQTDPNVLQLKGVEIGESDDSVYQVPQNGAPVEGTDAEYAVPKSNKPVEEDAGGNLLDLEDQLTNIEQGIEQMSSFDTLFDDLPTSTAPTAATSSSSAMDDLAWATAPASSAPAVPASQALAGLGQTTTPFGIPSISGPGTPFPSSTSAPGPFQTGFPGTSVQPGFGVPSPRSGSPFGAPFARSSSPFAQPSGFQQSPGLPPPGLQPPPRTATKIPVATDPFANDPFASFATQNVPGGMNQGNMFGSAAGNPFGAPSSTGASMFPPSPTPAGNDSGWPNAAPDLLAPMKVGGEPDFSNVPEKKKDVFGDLCDIGSFGKEKKSPKDMFKDINAPAKKSLNELKSENLKVAANPALPHSPQPIFGSGGDPFGMPAPNAAPAVAAPLNDPFGSFPPIPTTQQASHDTDPFGPLDKTIQKIPDLASSSADPFDTSTFLHISTPAKSSLPSQSAQSNADKETISPAKIVPPASIHPRPRPKAKKPESILSDNKSIEKTIYNDNGFNIPSPDEPPPPLPSDALILSKNAPKPPPRPPSVTSKPSTPSRSNSVRLNSSLSVQSNLSVSSLGSEDHDIESTSTSTNVSPVPRTKPRRCNSTASSTDQTENRSSSVTSPVSPSSSDATPNHNIALQRYPVPKPRKSLTKKPSNVTLNYSSLLPSVSTPSNNEYSNHNLKDLNDNDPFLSSQPNSVKFDSNWDAFDSDPKWNAFASEDPFSSDQNNAFASSSSPKDAFSIDTKISFSDLKNTNLSDSKDPFANDSKWDPFSSDFDKSIPVNSINESKEIW